MMWSVSGNVTYLRKPFPNAEVTIQLAVGDRTEVRRVQTDQYANFKVRVPLQAGRNDAIDWSVEAVSPDFLTAKRSGRRIMTDLVTNEDLIIDLSGDLELASSKLYPSLAY